MKTFRLVACMLTIAGAGLVFAPAMATAQTVDGGDEQTLEQTIEQCLSLMQDGETLRECTLTERFGQCLTWSIDAYEVCKEDGGLLQTLKCWYLYVFDAGDCVSDLIADLIPICNTGSGSVD